MLLCLGGLRGPLWVMAAAPPAAGLLDRTHEALGTPGLILLVAAITVVLTLLLVRWSFIRPIHRTAR